VKRPEPGAALLAPERRAKIMDLLGRNKSVLVKDLCALFSVTGETVRKDLSILEQEGKLIKTYGGAYIHQGVRNEVDISIRESLLTEAKASIGRACAELVRHGDTVSLDESTTCLAIARHLTGIDGLTVVTNSLKIANHLSAHSSCRLHLVGGKLDRKTQCFVGPTAEEALCTYYVDKAFVSCRGLSREGDVTDGLPVNGSLRRLMLSRAKERYLVADRTKLGLTTFYRISGFENLDAVILDTLDDDWSEFFAQRGIRVVEAMPKGGTK
jgi:DeoR/GlpR family transcriptional regulator of sugar metabolism